MLNAALYYHKSYDLSITHLYNDTIIKHTITINLLTKEKKHNKNNSPFRVQVNGTVILVWLVSSENIKIEHFQISFHADFQTRYECILIQNHYA